MPLAASLVRRMQPLRRTLARALGSDCLVCGQWQTEALCDDCLSRFASPGPRCPTCARAWPKPVVAEAGRSCPACLREPPPLDHCIAAFDYAYPWDGLILRLKHSPAAHGATALADRLVAAVEADPAAATVQLVVPVPLSDDRLRERGHNQAWELARRVAASLGRPARHDLLARRPGAHQQGLDRAARQRNVRGLFYPAARHAPARWAEGLHVALVDDVMTTGATVHEAARVLRAGGAAEVQAWVLARTPD